MKYPDLPQYVLHNADKEPCNATGDLIDPHDPNNWMSHADATTTAASTGLGVGFVLTANDPYFVVDIDKCRDPITGTYDQRATEWYTALSGCAAEVSRSGTGLHIWGRCDQTLSDNYKNKADGIEFYSRKRYIALGSDLVGDMNAPTADATEVLRSRLKPRDTSDSDLPADGPVPEYTGPADDGQLLQIISAARPSAGVAFGAKASFRELWNADETVLARVYPAYGDDVFDRSSADAALLSHLAFWTGRDLSRMERLWLSSPLAQSRPDPRKLRRADYRAATVRGAAEMVQEVYSKPPVTGLPDAPVEISPTQDGADLPVGGYLTVSDQIKHFEGCAYIAEEHVVLDRDGELRRPEQFRVMYGGYEFQMTPDGSKPTKDAFEAFTQSRVHRFPRVERRRYWPDKPFGLVVDKEINMFRMPDVAMTDEPVEPFLDLVSKLLPDDQDRAVLLAWMASLVQNRGTKFQWAPVLQGTEGNGKTFLLKCLEYAVGQSVSHLPNPEDMDEKYNTYIEGNLFIGVEEIHMSGRREILDRLKKYITNDRVELRGMRADKRMADNLTNWMFLTNYQDAVLKSRNDRRYAIFFTAQQSHDDLLRDGMGGGYFPSLWGWARGGGFAAVAGWLKRYAVPHALDPAGECHRAPRTSSTDAAIAHSLGGIEQAILEAVDEDVPGFCGGWVSSIRLRDYLKERGWQRVSPTVMSDALRNIGYERYGRGPKIVQEKNCKPVLYVDKNGPTVENYLDAQGYTQPAENIVNLRER